jgi:hypothetical protein
MPHFIEIVFNLLFFAAIIVNLTVKEPKCYGDSSGVVTLNAYGGTGNLNFSVCSFELKYYFKKIIMIKIYQVANNPAPPITNAILGGCDSSSAQQWIIDESDYTIRNVGSGL